MILPDEWANERCSMLLGSVGKAVASRTRSQSAAVDMMGVSLIPRPRPSVLVDGSLDKRIRCNEMTCDWCSAKHCKDY